MRQSHKRNKRAGKLDGDTESNKHSKENGAIELLDPGSYDRRSNRSYESRMGIIQLEDEDPAQVQTTCLSGSPIGNRPQSRHLEVDNDGSSTEEIDPRSEGATLSIRGRASTDGSSSTQTQHPDHQPGSSPIIVDIGQNRHPVNSTMIPHRSPIITVNGTRADDGGRSLASSGSPGDEGIYYRLVYDGEDSQLPVMIPSGHLTQAQVHHSDRLTPGPTDGGSTSSRSSPGVEEEFIVATKRLPDSRRPILLPTYTPMYQDSQLVSGKSYPQQPHVPSRTNQPYVTSHNNPYPPTVSNSLNGVHNPYSDGRLLPHQMSPDADRNKALSPVFQPLTNGSKPNGLYMARTTIPTEPKAESTIHGQSTFYPALTQKPVHISTDLLNQGVLPDADRGHLRPTSASPVHSAPVMISQDLIEQGVVPTDDSLQGSPFSEGSMVATMEFNDTEDDSLGIDWSAARDTPSHPRQSSVGSASPGQSSSPASDSPTSRDTHIPGSLEDLNRRFNVKPRQRSSPPSGAGQLPGVHKRVSPGRELASNTKPLDFSSDPPGFNHTNAPLIAPSHASTYNQSPHYPTPNNRGSPPRGTVVQANPLAELYNPPVFGGRITNPTISSPTPANNHNKLPETYIGQDISEPREAPSEVFKVARDKPPHIIQNDLNPPKMTNHQVPDGHDSRPRPDQPTLLQQDSFGSSLGSGSLGQALFSIPVDVQSEADDKTSMMTSSIRIPRPRPAYGGIGSTSIDDETTSLGTRDTADLAWVTVLTSGVGSLFIKGEGSWCLHIRSRASAMAEAGVPRVLVNALFDDDLLHGGRVTLRFVDYFALFVICIYFFPFIRFCILILLSLFTFRSVPYPMVRCTAFASGLAKVQGRTMRRPVIEV